MNGIILDVPPVFAEDHDVARCLPTGEFIGIRGGHWRYSCTMEELEEWLSDAEYYSDCTAEGWDFPGQVGMQSSARASVRAPLSPAPKWRTEQ